MVLGFIQHLYGYFQSPSREVVAPHSHYNNVLENIVPIFGHEGRIIGYIPRQAAASQAPDPPLQVGSIQPITDASARNTQSVTLPNLSHSISPPHSILKNPLSIPKILGTAAPTSLPPPAPASPEDIPEWNPWPDGIFQHNFSWEEVSRTKRLLTHWVERTSGGDRRGAEDADVWDKGKRLTRTCLGVLVCDNQDCQRITRLMTNPSQFKKQLASACRCGAEFKHQTCGVRSILWSWSGGIHYQHDGFHYHSRPPAIRSTTDEQNQFAALVQQNPKSGPLQLIVGVPTVEGPGKSVADISEIYINADRVAKERQKIRRGNNGFGTGDSFIATFADFDMKHPGFLVSEVFGSVTVISFQTPFMLSRLVHEYIDDDAVNGLVNDAAHGWWKETNSLLMISSVYSPDLSCWVPGILSYTNGATANHFSHHFRALFEGIAVEAEKRGIKVEDKLFVGVMDFSEAERTSIRNSVHLQESGWKQERDTKRH